MSSIDLTEASNKKTAVGLCAIFFGGFGVHKFILGYTQPGLIMLLLSMLTCGVGFFVMGVIGVVEGIIYLAKTPEEFAQTYLENQRPWF